MLSGCGKSSEQTEYCPAGPTVSGYTAPTDTAFEAHAGMMRASECASLPEAAAHMMPCAVAELMATASG
jgi:hypothetical protein